MNSRIGSLAVILFIVLLPQSMAFAMDQMVVVTDYWPPFRIQSGHEITGIDKDLMAEISKRMRVEVVFQREPWARCLLDMEDGTADMMTGLAKTPEREKYIVYSDIPYYSCAPAFYERKGRKGAPIKTYGDLYNFAIGYTRDSAYFEPFNSDKKLRKIAGNNEAQLVEMTKEGRMDVFIGTDCQVDYDLAQRGLTDRITKTPYRPDVHVDLYVGVSRESPLVHRMDEINQILKDMVESGMIKGIADTYFDAESNNQSR